MSTPLLHSLGGAWSAGPSGAIPSWFRERQRRALDAALAVDWPTRVSEAWRYTSLHALSQASLVPVERLPGDVNQEGRSDPWALSFVDGFADPSVVSAEGLMVETLAHALAGDSETLRFAFNDEPEEGDVFERLNAAFAVDGAWIRVDPGAAPDRWLRLQSRSSATMDGAAWHLAHRIDVGEGARIRVSIDADTDPSASGLATVMSRIRVQRDAELDLVWTARPAATVAAIARTRIELDRGAVVRMHVLDGGAAPSRHDLHVALRGEQASVQLGGVFLLGDRRHADVQLDLRHEAPDARSQTTWRAIAADRSRAVFNGHITVAAGADGTDAQLGCKSLLGSVQAEIDAKPVLEIYADDVKCAHGTTVGQLDEQALFYLRTRGLDEPSARALLTRAFAAEALAGIEGSSALSLLEAWLGSVPG